MPETTTAPTEPNTPTSEKVFNLSVELKDVKLRKKDFNKSMNEEIKRIQKEIDELIETNEMDQGSTVPATTA